MLTLQQLNNIINSNVEYDVSTRLLSKFTNKCFICSFITNFYRCNPFLDKTALVAAIIYMYRYNKMCKLSFANIKPVLETCLILANKYCFDFEITDSGPLEIHVLKTIDWKLYISNKEYDLYYNSIKTFSDI